MEIYVVKQPYSQQPTYYINGQPLCFRPLSELGKEDQYCSLVAGHGTEHLGEGACYRHYGKAGNTVFKTGRYSDKAKRQLKQYYDEYYSDPNFLTLTSELALARALLADAVRDYKGSANERKNLAGLIEKIVGVVATMENIDSKKVLTAAVGKYMMTKAVYVAQKFVPADLMPEFMRVWRAEVQNEIIAVPQLVEGQPAIIVEMEEIEE